MTQSTQKVDKTEFWILPHRVQSDESNIIFNGKFCQLDEAIDVGRLPKTLILGIPEEAVEKYTEDENLIFAQFIRQPEMYRCILGLSVKAGYDITNRIVFLTYLIVFDGNPNLAIPIELPIESLLPTEDAKYANALRTRLIGKDFNDGWIKTVYNLIDEVKSNQNDLSFANIHLDRIYYKYDWTPQKKRTYKFKLSEYLMGLVLLAVLFIIGLHQYK